MKAAVFRDGDLVVDQVPEPTVVNGQVLVKTLACGICGSDLHAFHHGERMVSMTKRVAPQAPVMDLKRDVVFGHEFCAEILEHGPGTEKKFAVGTRVCSMPIAVTETGINTLGYSNDAAGGFAERMALNEMLLLEVPNGLATDHATLTEPMAVGWHAVEKASLQEDDLPLVIGCGPVGLAVIAGLKIKGVGPIIAADFSPARRELAKKMGADIIIDPAKTSPYATWLDEATPEGFDPTSLMTMLGMGPKLRPGVIFECVGIPGIVQQMLEGAPKDARIIVVGVCMETDTFEPYFAIMKQLNLHFVLGYSPEEFAQTLHHLGEGMIDVAPMVTGKVPVEGVKEAFKALASPDVHAKILVEPWK
ncbi:MAG: zinc-binding dehydrogenase [Parvibaculaceae bacterium]|nr:zinc-binding dehydrogenase [Parvibaculaceae bacterium]